MKTIDKASHSAHKAYDKLADVAGDAAEVLGEKGEQLKKAEQKLMQNCRGYISDNPITSVSIAVVAGFLVSRVLSRR